MSAAKRLNEPWKPGQSGNPNGRPALPEHLRKIPSISRPELCKVISKYWRMNCTELKEILKQKTVSAGEMAIISIIAKCIEYGDPQRLSFLLEQALGKIPVVVENDADRAARQEIEELSDIELIQLVKEKLPEIEATKKEE